MSASEGSDLASQRVSKQAVAKQFVRLYYSILNTHNGYLYQFYGKNSSVTVRETTQEKTFAETAEDETSVKELLHSFYADVSVKVDSAVPQFSVDDTVLLHINGTMQSKTDYTMPPRAFAQVFILCPQENGYYVRTDLTHVLSNGHNRPLLAYWQQNHAGAIEGGIGASSSSSERDHPIQIGSYEGEIPEEGRNIIRTSTPPLEDTPRIRDKSHESDRDSEDAPGRHSQPWIVRSQGTKMASVTHAAPVPPTVMMPPPVAVPPMHSGAPSIIYPLDMNSHRYLRQRSMSMGCDPWSAQSQMGHGVFIARLPFGVQPADVEEAFAGFGPILGGREGIQVRDGRNGCYAFVTFENPDSARIAIQQGAVIQGKRVFIEPRYPRREAGAAMLAYPHMMAAPMPYMSAPNHPPRMP